VPEDVGFATKPQIARRMIACAITAKVPFPFVAADSVYGTDDIETMLRKAGKGYVLGVASNHVFRAWSKEQLVGGTATKIAQNLPKNAWQRLSAGEGTKGPRLHDWAYLELADLDAGEYNNALAGEWTRGLLIRRNIADGDLAFFSTWCPKGTPKRKLVSVEGHRWAIEDSFEAAKHELGLDHPKKRCGAFGPNFPDPLVDPGNPPHRPETRATAHPARQRHRMVTLATRPPSPSTARSSQKEKTTVMLGTRPESTSPLHR